MLNSCFKISGRAKGIFFLILFIVALGCEDIVEEDLEGETVEIISPPDHFSSTSGTIEFNWSELEGGESYHLQVVRPTFDSLVSIRLDSLVTGLGFQYSFAPGEYQWRIRAENFNSASNWTIRNFSVDSLIDISGVQVQLIAPAQNFISSADSLQFTWSPLPTANEYRLNIYENELNGPLIAGPFLLDGSNYIMPMTEGLFVWSLQALSSSSNSELSFRNLTIDQTAPMTGVLSFPENQSTLPSDTVFSFQWSPGSDALTQAIDSLFIVDATDSNVLYRLSSANAQVNTDTLLLLTYAWEVRTYDEAGNSSVTDVWTFSIE